MFGERTKFEEVATVTELMHCANISEPTILSREKSPCGELYLRRVMEIVKPPSGSRGRIGREAASQEPFRKHCANPARGHGAPRATVLKESRDQDARDATDD